MRAAGRFLMAIAVIHFLFGVGFGLGRILEIARDGAFNAVDSHPHRQLIFWFVVFAVPLYLLGLLVSWIGSQRERAPAWLGWSLLAFGLVGAFLMPVSGFWLVIAPAVLLLRRAARRVSSAAPEVV